MPDTNKDLRKHLRYKVREGIFAAFSTNSLVGQVKNISKGGVSFTYIATEKSIDKNLELEIFTSDTRIYLKSIPFRVVSDTEAENHVPCSSLQMRQIRGAFIELTEDQKSQLDQFLSIFAEAEVSRKFKCERDFYKGQWRQARRNR